MAKQVLVINGHDYTSIVKRKGYGWSRNDLDSEKTVRLKNGTMRRDKIGTKRKLSYTILNATEEQLQQLDDDLSASTFKATYLDLHGTMTKTFYCSSFNVNLDAIEDGADRWTDGSFNITEV
jgi:trans-2-enoyl-CoA reductase